MSTAAALPAPERTAADLRALCGDFLTHVTVTDRVPAIMRDGLRPWDQVAAGPRARGWDEPRPGCVYLATARCRRYRPTIQETVLRVDPDQLDPQLLSPDEDFLTGLWVWRNTDPDPALFDGDPIGWESLGLTDPYGDDVMGRWPSRGAWAHEHAHLIDTPRLARASLLGEQTVAYRGTIPPHAITVVQRSWQ